MQNADLKTERLEARVTADAKALCQEADFVVRGAAVEAARRAVQENGLLQLTYRDRVAFVEALLNASPAPNAKLQKAADRRAKRFAG
jgi:uncharacterized protein (DUF1778 family)